LNYTKVEVIIIDSDELILYTQPDVNSTIENTIKKGSILFYTSSQDEFIEVFTKNPKSVRKKNVKKYQYYLNKPKYSSYTSGYSKNDASLVELPFDISKNYIRGPRGGCYYINSNTNKTYVSRSYCGSGYQSRTKYKTKKSTYKPKKSKSYSSTCGARTKSGGYCKRKVKGGGRCYQH